MKLGIVAAALLILAGEARAAMVEVSLRVEGPAPESPLPVIIRLQRVSAAGKSDASPAREHKAEAPGLKGLDVEPGSWELTAGAAGYWSQAKRILAGPDRIQTEIVLFPAAKVNGRLTVEPGEPMPREVTLRLASAVGTSPRPVPEVEMTCPVAESAFTCEVPAGRLDLRARAKGFISHYRWAVAVEGGKTYSFGTLALRRGASVSGWVVTADGSPLSPHSRARLEPRAAALAGSPLDLDRGKESALSSPVQSNGFFHLVGVPLGAYVLTVDHPGFAPVRFYPVQVQENAETQLLKPLLLQPSSTFSVFLDPATDPHGEPWRLQLYEIGAIPNYRELAAEGKTEPDGSWRRSGVTPGRYAIVVGDMQASVIENREVEVESPQTTVQIDLPLIWVEGRVRLGDEPLRSTLWFGGQDGKVKVRAFTDEEGRFVEALPREGKWALDVKADEPRVFRRFSAIEVRRPDGKKTARLEIDLHDTRLAGKVVDEKGNALPGAAVHVQSMEPTGERELPATVVADSQGAFQLAGLPPGPYRLEAHHGRPPGPRMVSEVVAVDVAEDRKTPETVLVLAKNRILNVRVTAQGRGVPQARIQGLPLLADGSGPMRGSSAITDVEGAARLELPARAAQLHLLVFPPGFAMKMIRLPLASQGDVLEISVEPAGGTIVVEIDGPPERSDRPYVVLVRDGVHASTPLLTSWAQVQGVAQEPGKLIIPAVEAGLYEACVKRLADAYQAEGASPTVGGSCARGTLAPIGELRLKLRLSQDRAAPAGR